MIVYLVTSQCDDTYYPDHPTRIAFTTQELAEAFVKSRNGEDEWGYYYNVRKIELLDSLDNVPTDWYK